MRLGEGLGNQRDADDDLGAGAEAGEKAEEAELKGLRETLQGGEHAEHQDAERQRAHPADIVGDDAEMKPPNAQPSSPAMLKKPPTRPISASVACRQQLGQCRPQHQREQAEIGSVERPAGPHNDEHQPLVAGDIA